MGQEEESHGALKMSKMMALYEGHLLMLSVLIIYKCQEYVLKNNGLFTIFLLKYSKCEIYFLLMLVDVVFFIFACCNWINNKWLMNWSELKLKNAIKCACVVGIEITLLTVDKRKIEKQKFKFRKLVNTARKKSHLQSDLIT